MMLKEKQTCFRNNNKNNNSRRKAILNIYIEVVI